jgi:hypothetical protein
LLETSGVLGLALDLLEDVCVGRHEGFRLNQLIHPESQRWRNLNLDKKIRGTRFQWETRKCRGTIEFSIFQVSLYFCFCGGFFGKGARITLAVRRRMSWRAALPSEKKGWISCASKDFHSLNRGFRGVECSWSPKCGFDLDPS